MDLNDTKVVFTFRPSDCKTGHVRLLNPVQFLQQSRNINTLGAEWLQASIRSSYIKMKSSNNNCFNSDQLESGFTSYEPS